MDTNASWPSRYLANCCNLLYTYTIILIMSLVQSTQDVTLCEYLHLLALINLNSRTIFLKFQLFFEKIPYCIIKIKYPAILTSISLPTTSDSVPSANQYTKLLKSQYYKFNQLTFLHRCFSAFFYEHTKLNLFNCQSL